jgi:hypothetical protein
MNDRVLLEINTKTNHVQFRNGPEHNPPRKFLITKAWKLETEETTSRREKYLTANLMNKMFQNTDKERRSSVQFVSVNCSFSQNVTKKTAEFVEIGKSCKMHIIHGMHKGFWWTTCKKETIWKN